MLGVPPLWNPPPVEGAPLSTRSELRLPRGLSLRLRGQLSLRLHGVLVWHRGRRKGTPRWGCGQKGQLEDLSEDLLFAPRAMSAREAQECLVNEDWLQGPSKCFLDDGLTGSLSLQGPRTGRESDTLARITMARTGSLEGQEGLNGPARRRGHSESPIFIDTAVTVPGTAVNQRNCWE